MATLKDLSVDYISLVKTPATGKLLTLKSGKRAATFEIVKTDDELMRAYGIVYAPDQPDSHGDSADAATIRKAQAAFMREGRLKNIDIEHSFTPEMAFVAESWLVRQGDALFPDEPAGAWAVGIQVGDPDLWRQLKSGALTGLSLAGTARMEPDPAAPRHTEKTDGDDAPGWALRFVKSITQRDPAMTEKTDDSDRLKALVDAAVAAALKAEGDKTEAPDGAEDDKVAGLVEEKIKAVSADLKKTIDERLAKALAKGEAETDNPAETLEEAFA